MVAERSIDNFLW